jgi:hypothetical protein
MRFGVAAEAGPRGSHRAPEASPPVFSSSVVDLPARPNPLWVSTAEGDAVPREPATGGWSDSIDREPTGLEALVQAEASSR